MRQPEDEQNDESQEDEIKREDGRVRYWMFFNGDQVRLFSALVAAFFGVLWCFLYVFGAGQSVFGIVLGVLTIGCFFHMVGAQRAVAEVCRERLEKRQAFFGAGQSQNWVRHSSLVIYFCKYRSYTAPAMVARSLAARFLFSIVLVLCVALPHSLAKKKPPAKPVNINTASSEELQQVPGIGPATAQKILQMRKSYGPFKSVDDLLAIRGLGEKRLDKMRKYLTVSKSVAPKSTLSGPSPTPPQKEQDKP